MVQVAFLLLILQKHLSYQLDKRGVFCGTSVHKGFTQNTSKTCFKHSKILWQGLVYYFISASAKPMHSLPLIISAAFLALK